MPSCQAAFEILVIMVLMTKDGISYDQIILVQPFFFEVDITTYLLLSAFDPTGPYQEHNYFRTNPKV